MKATTQIVLGHAAVFVTASIGSGLLRAANPESNGLAYAALAIGVICGFAIFWSGSTAHHNITQHERADP